MATELELLAKEYAKKKVTILREDIQKMIDLGVDGLITDYPNRSPKLP
jgi:glycerophosphoryl diester phosphodiesterase